jgi:hypothetical protein
VQRDFNSGAKGLTDYLASLTFYMIRQDSGRGKFNVFFISSLGDKLCYKFITYHKIWNSIPAQCRPEVRGWETGKNYRGPAI